MKQRQEGGHEFVDPLAAKQAHGESTSPAMPQLRKIPGKEEGKAPKNGKEPEGTVSPGWPVKLRKVEGAPTASPQVQGIPVQLKKVEPTPTQGEPVIKGQLDASGLREVAIDQTPLGKTITGRSRCFAISIVLGFGVVLMAAVVMIGRWPISGRTLSKV
jgi:hypothetical protein